jgi:hypothetical protein
MTLEAAGRLDAAIPQYRKALEPDHPKAQANLDRAIEREVAGSDHG